MPDGQNGYHPAWFQTEKSGTDTIARDHEGDIIAKMPLGATFFDQTYFSYIDGYSSDYSDLGNELKKSMWSAFVHSPLDHSGEPGYWDQLRTRTIELKEKTDKALMVVVGCNLFEWGTFLRRMDNFLTDLFMFPVEVERLLDILMEFHMETLEKAINAVGDIVDIIRFGDDLGMSTGPFVPIETYRQFFKLRHKILKDYVKKKSNLKMFLHSCDIFTSSYPSSLKQDLTF